MRKIILILMAVFPLLAMAQTPTRVIKGQVLDKMTGQPLVGATVFIDVKANPEAASYNPQGTVAEKEGRFEFKLPTSVKTVIVSYLGYQEVKLDITGNEPFKVMLSENTSKIDEVVVTGYQKIEKRKVTSAVTTVKMDDIKSIGVGSVDQMLEGKVAGMISTPVTGAPGAPNKIRIRSTVSLSGSTDPLWVVDGVPLEGNDIPRDFSSKDNIDNLMNTSIAGLNPDDIQDITVLKDAAATAIYGARAANGVIVVTTKKGAKGKPKVSASLATFITTKPDFGKLNLMNASEKVDFELGLAANPLLNYRSDRGEVARILAKNGDLINYRQNGFEGISAESQRAINALRTSGTNWGDQLYRTAINQQYNLNVSGGGDFATYYFSGGYFNEQGTTRGTGFERFNLTLKTDMNLTDRLKFGVALYGTQSTRNSYLTETDVFTNPANYSRNVNPYLNIKDANGNYIYDKDMKSNDDVYLPFNFGEEMDNTKYEMNNRSLKSVFTLDYRANDWLKLSTQFGMQLENTDTEKFADKETYFTRKYRQGTRYSDKGVEKFFLPDGGIIQNWNSKFSQYYWKAQAEMSHTFADKHDVDLMVGTEMRADESVGVHTKGFGYNPKTLQTSQIVFPQGSTEMTNKKYIQYQNSLLENRHVSYFMTGSYTYDNRYTVFGSVRYDGSNLFGVDPKYKYLPLWSLSGAWNVNREKFMENVEWLDNLKVRASYGLQGNIDKNTSPFIVGTWDDVTVLPGTNEPSIGVTSPPNQKLRWEKTKTWNAGVDVAVLNNRISGSVDVYQRKSVDLIDIKALELENGFDFTTMNWAQVSNKGIEVSLSTANIRTKDFSWSTDFNIARNVSNVDAINIRDNELYPSRQGYPVGAVFAVKTAGVDENGLPMFWKGDKKVSSTEFFKLQTVDMWGMQFPQTSLTNQEYRELFTYVGNTEPKFTGGLINKFRYKNFDLTVSASFTLDQTVKANPFYNPATTGPDMNYSRDVANIWSTTNRNGKFPGLVSSAMAEGSDPWMYYQWLNGLDASNSYSHYDSWYKNISYMRISSIRLGYTFPAKFTKKLHIAAARLNFEARNPFVFGSSYKGYFDPETYGSIYAQPLAKTFSVGLNISF